MLLSSHWLMAILPCMTPFIYAMVLAAGLSRRMGAPKQLLSFGNQTVLQSVVDTLLGVDLSGVLVVLGHEAERVQKSLTGRHVFCCLNDAYQTGMFSSVLCGLRHLPPSADAALIVLCDQPQISADVIKSVIDAYKTSQKGLVIPVWNGKRGHPVLIDLHRYRRVIETLSGEVGLKPLMRGYPEDTLEIGVDDAGILRDIDTPEDYRQELERQQKAHES